MSDPAASPSASRWVSAWPDALAFVAGLGLAWYGQWQTRDLVWSLWLSSLLVGYAMIGWNVFGSPMTPEGATGPATQLAGPALLIGRLFMLAFFTVHFGMFHFVHSVFLNGFFPVDGTKALGPSLALYGRVFAEFWPFVLVAAVAERRAFRRTPLLAMGNAMTAPYKNVVRLHLLIFFFAFAHFAHLESFAVYVVVYAVYFFPWRLLRREG